MFKRLATSVSALNPVQTFYEMIDNREGDLIDAGIVPPFDSFSI